MDTPGETDNLFGLRPALKQLADNWWLFLAQGILSIILGVLALVWPGSTLVVLTVLFGLLLLLNGIVVVMSAIGFAASNLPWGWRLTIGLLDILAGLIVIRWPGETAVTVLLFIGFWAILVGISQVIGGIADHAALSHAWLVALDGVVSIIFGILMVVWPAAGLLTLALLVGIFAIVHGLDLCAVAFRARSFGQRLATRTPPTVAGGTPAY